MKKRNAAGMEKESCNNVLNIHTAMDDDNENDINESQNDSDFNTDNLHVSLNKTVFLFHIFLIIVLTCFCCSALTTRIQRERAECRNQKNRSLIRHLQ